MATSAYFSGKLDGLGAGTLASLSAVWNFLIPGITFVLGVEISGFIHFDNLNRKELKDTPGN